MGGIAVCFHNRVRAIRLRILSRKGDVIREKAKVLLMVSRCASLEKSLQLKYEHSMA